MRWPKIYGSSMNPILVTRSRGSITESLHRGTLCIVNAKGSVVKSIGDIDQPCFTRSALKLFQAIPLLESGAADALALTQEELAITCGSHNAETAHVEAVESLLAKCGLDSSYLQCGPQMPTGRIPRKALMASGLAPTDLHNNCSGKHAGFLALCVHRGWPIEGYLETSHPLQKLIKSTCAEVFELHEEDFIMGEDGCSAPNYATSLYHQALAYKNLVIEGENDLRNTACKRIVQACLQQPFLIAGSDRYCTDIIRASEGRVLGKTGADGVFCMAFPELQLGVALKIDDGKMGPQYTVAQALIEALGISLVDDLTTYRETPIKNWNKHEIGMQKPSSDLLNLLQDLRT